MAAVAAIKMGAGSGHQSPEEQPGHDGRLELGIPRVLCAGKGVEGRSAGAYVWIITREMVRVLPRHA